MKKGGSRGGAAAKKPLAVPPEEDGSYIVFGDGKSEKKAKKQEHRVPRDNMESSNSQVVSEEVAKKPDTRTLIGGASWTGKLPVNMLSEHCQKQKWAKPEYTMVIISSQYTSGFIGY